MQSSSIYQFFSVSLVHFVVLIAVFAGWISVDGISPDIQQRKSLFCQPVVPKIYNSLHRQQFVSQSILKGVTFSKTANSILTSKAFKSNDIPDDQLVLSEQA